MLAAIVLAVVLAVAAGGALGLNVGGDPSTDADGAAYPNARAGAASDSSQGRSGTSPGSATESRPTPSEVPDPTASGPAADPAPTVRGGVRIVPEAPGAAPAYQLPRPDSATRTPLPTRDELPTQAVFARGRLVAGYPARLLPRAPGGSVISSSVAPSPDRVQVALVGTRGRERDRVLRFYRVVLTRAGFREIPVPAVGGSSAAAFTRGASQVVVTVDPAETRTYSIYANLVIDKA